MNQMSKDGYLGFETAKEPKSVVVDYGGANVAKPLHVGHLRSAIIGEGIKRLAKKMGHRVLGDIHLGDWGYQMGLIITELRERQPELPYFQEDFEGEYPKEAPFTIGELEEIYPKAAGRRRTRITAGKPLRRPGSSRTGIRDTGRYGDISWMCLWQTLRRIMRA